MHFTTIAAAAAAFVGLAAAAPLEQRQSSTYSNVVYWGQNNGEKSLGSYCSADSGIDVLVLSFLYVWGGAVKIPYGNFGEQCAVLQDGTGQNCDQLIADIKTCKSAGKKVLLSLGGASGSYSLGSADEATTLANAVWNSYAAPGSVDASAPRPLGDAFVDGFDMDIEASSATTYLADLVTALRANFAKDTAHTYVITGAPQCPIPEPNMGAGLLHSQFDMLFIQFYNNYCSADQYVRGDKTQFNFGSWGDYLSTGPSANAKLYLGLPASTLGSTGSASGAHYFLSVSELTTVVDSIKSVKNFAGVMLWSAFYSDSEVDNGKTYAQNVRAVLDA